MAASKKVSGVKKLSKKAKVALKSDIFTSIALFSILLNMFFLTGIVMFQSTNELDESLYRTAFSQLCIDNYEMNKAEIAAEADSKERLAGLDATCVEGGFDSYYNDALNRFFDERGLNNKAH